MKLNLEPNKSKVSQLVEALSSAISKGVYKAGETLPSIRVLSAKYNLSRDTVYKAYQELREKGIVESTPTKGYFVFNRVKNIFVLLDIFTPYKEDLYNELTSKLHEDYNVDLFFHHYNERSYNNMILDSIGRYDLYLITNFQNDVYSKVLDRLDNTKVLLLDLGKFKKDKFSYVCQGFDSTLYNCLMSGLDKLKKYSELYFFIHEKSEHPKSCLPYFVSFCVDNGFKYNIRTKDIKEIDIQPNRAYLISRHKDLVDFVKICRKKDLEIGEDVGVITFNDAPMLEIIENGISVITTDFKMMGSCAAEFVVSNKKIQTYIPTKLILRGSL
ncbi:MAG: GntR family transcriptional regulator [Bacteroidales bacterium]|nr:GntR family transcriptional regulator [Bacteroidales bacterium]